MNKLKELWFWFWEDDSTPHGKIPPYTKQIVILLFVGGMICKLFEYLYQKKNYPLLNMSSFKNIVCLDLVLGQEIAQDHLFNMEIISKNLEDFNERFESDIMLSYEADDCLFEPLEEDDEHALWFCEGIPELLDFSQSSKCNDEKELDLYLENRSREMKYLYSPQLYEPYAKRYFDYAPIGFLTDESMDYIKYEMNNLLFGE